jgi:hypothetical protein
MRAGVQHHTATRAGKPAARKLAGTSCEFGRVRHQLRISANVTGDFGNVTDFGRALGCAEKIVGMEWIRAGLEPPRFMLMGA